MSILQRAREDIETVFDKDPAAKSWWEVVCCYPGLHAIWLHRLAHALWQRRLLLLGRLVSHLSRWLTGVEIHPGAEIGRRLFVDHGMGVVIGETSKIGEDVLLYQGVVLGGTTLEKVKRHPTLGDNVVIGSGATVLGAIAIGDNAKVGAGSVVVRSVPPGATVVGVPARLVGQPQPGRDQVDLEHGKLADPVVQALSEAFDRQSRLEERIRTLEKRLDQGLPAPAEGIVPPVLDEGDLASRVRSVLREVIDPEVGVSLMDLGFVHDVSIDGQRVHVQLALPEPRCPFMEYFVVQIRRRVKSLNGLDIVEVTFLDPVSPAEGQTPEVLVGER